MFSERLLRQGHKKSGLCGKELSVINGCRCRVGDSTETELLVPILSHAMFNPFPHNDTF